MYQCDNCDAKHSIQDTNPKTRFGAAKPSLCLVPSSGLVHEAMAFADGANKYGAYNWREKAVSTMTYLNAASRHIHQFLDREDFDLKSGVHHLGHAKACLSIILDALLCENLIDDRPPKADISGLIESYTQPIAEECECSVQNLDEANQTDTTHYPV